MLIVVNDGSSDRTPEILKDYQRRHSKLLRVLDLPDNGYDIRRVPRNINLACIEAETAVPKTDFFMISGDDCSYPINYAQLLISRMESKPQIVIASGKPSSDAGLRQEHSPSGSGRMVRRSFWNEIGGKYPVKAGWETWLLYKALERKFEVKLFDDLVFHHMRPRGAKHQFAYWGAAMYTLGYHPLYTVGRIAKNTIGRGISVKGSLHLVRGYLQARLGPSDPFMSPFERSLRKFVFREHAKEIGKRIKTNLASIK